MLQLQVSAVAIYIDVVLGVSTNRSDMAHAVGMLTVCPKAPLTLDVSINAIIEEPTVPPAGHELRRSKMGSRNPQLALHAIDLQELVELFIQGDESIYKISSISHLLLLSFSLRAEPIKPSHQRLTLFLDASGTSRTPQKGQKLR
jgi:hypothetical protein